MSSSGVARIEGVDPFVAFKAPCKVATTANITLSGAQTIDGVAVAATTVPTRVLVRSQTDQTQNGIYNVSGTAWTRAEDFDGNRDIVQGTFIGVQSGTTYGGATFKVAASDPVTIGSTSITFVLANPIGSTTIIGSAAVDTYADLLALNPNDFSAGDVVFVSGDLISGEHKVVASALASPDGGTTQSNASWFAASKHLKRLALQGLVPEHFGAKGDKVTDDTLALQAFFDYYEALNTAQPNTTPTCSLKKGSVYYVTSQVVANNFGIQGNGAVLYSDQNISILQVNGQNNIYSDFFVRYDASTSNTAREAIQLTDGTLQNAKNEWNNVVIRNPYRGFVWRGGSGSAGGTAACTFIQCRVDFNWDWGFYADCSLGTTTLTMINCQQFGSLAGGSTAIKGFYINNCADVSLLGTTSMDQVYDGLALQITGAKTVKVDMVILESCELKTDNSRMIDINGGDVKLGPVHSKVGTYDLPDPADEAYMVQIGSTTSTVDLDTVTLTNTASTTGTIYSVRMASNVKVAASHIDLDDVQTNGLYSQFYNFGDHEGYSNTFANLPTAGVARRVMWNRSPNAGEASYWIDDGAAWQAGPIIHGGSAITATTAQFADITHAVNTLGKFQGKMVADTTTGLIMVANGSTAGATWQPSDGGAVTTPV